MWSLLREELLNHVQSAARQCEISSKAHELFIALTLLHAFSAPTLDG